MVQGQNDVIQAAANIHYGGTLNLVNISSSPLVAGNSFQVFSAASYTGSFAKPYASGTRDQVWLGTRHN